MRKLILLLGLVVPGTGFAQNYSIDWHTIAGGGGVSSNGQFTVRGTIGQAAVTPQGMSGGSFSLISGFWSLFAVQSPGAPALNVRLTSTNTALIYWPSASTSWTLQVNPNLAAGLWSAPSENVIDNGSIKYVIINPPTGTRLYRLKFP